MKIMKIQIIRQFKDIFCLQAEKNVVYSYQMSGAAAGSGDPAASAKGINGKRKDSDYEKRNEEPTGIVPRKL